MDKKNEKENTFGEMFYNQKSSGVFVHEMYKTLKYVADKDRKAIANDQEMI